MSFFVDVHSHVVPSGDDGAQRIIEGRGLFHIHPPEGPVLYATPHVWPHLVLTEEREELVRANFAELTSEELGLELRLGFELTPAPPLLEQDLRRYVLDGTNAVLIEVPFTGGERLLVEICELMEEQRLQPVIAHPERTEAVLDKPSLAREFAERGWLLQVNGSSLTGRHGAEIESLAWDLIDESLVGLVGSDGHRGTRPAVLDDAYAVVEARVGETQARALFDGSAIGIAIAHDDISPLRQRARSARL